MAKKILKTALLALSLLAPLSGRASDIFIGVKGPTDFQSDTRVSYSNMSLNGVKTKTVSLNQVFKYWTGIGLGVYAFANIPYKHLDNGLESTGLGDVIFGAGPRGAITFDNESSLNIISSGAISLPAGDATKIPALGNDRFDFKAGLNMTYLSPRKWFDVDGSFEYTLAGKTSKGVQGFDEISTGLVAGGKLTDNNLVRIAFGGTAKIVGSNRGSKYSSSSRVVLRITPPDQTIHHEEIIFDYPVFTREMPRGPSVIFQSRINF